MTVAPSSLNSPMEVDVIYCGLCGSVFGVARVDSPD
jgi:hypothetical protein